MKIEIVKQLSVFLLNKPGVLGDLCATFAEHGINIFGLSISDTVDHAVVRVVTDKPKEAVSQLEARGVLVVETDVLAITLPDQPGMLSALSHKLAKAKINIEYAYGTTEAEGGILIVRTSDVKASLKLLKNTGKPAAKKKPAAKAAASKPKAKAAPAASK